MKECAVARKSVERRSELRKQVDQYYSLKISIDGLDTAYQFKVWNKATKSMGFLVEEGSDILPGLKIGDTLNMKYYSTDLTYHSEYLETLVRHITKVDQGRVRGHYLVGLEISKSQEQEDIAQGLPFNAS